MNNRTTDYCINFLKSRDIHCFQGDKEYEVVVDVDGIALVLSQAEVNYRAELWLESELQYVREGKV